ncbi:MAG: DUF2891 domain-containing protein [Planctomycetaceae bacterium]|nr:DUF2891 domain-containing protein [Planctomycetaceae bacterium]
MTIPDPLLNQDSLQSQCEALIRISLDVLHREFPNHTQHLWRAEGDVSTPRKMHPAFYGCFDWHSAVHNHWALVRFLRLYPETSLKSEIEPALERSLTAENIADEMVYLSERERFEMPYGVAWLLMLCLELRESAEESSNFAKWRDELEPLEEMLSLRFFDWLETLPAPIRGGEHSQSAFAMGLVHDWATVCEKEAMLELIDEQARQFYLTDLPWPFRLEPSAYDFLSPGLAEADLLRRILDVEVYHAWVEDFLPQGAIVNDSQWLDPVESVNPQDGKLAHWSGLNLSRAWMLKAIASACGRSEMATKLSALANEHQTAGLEAIVATEYAGSHWLVSFAVYLLTARWRVSSPA